MKKTILCRGGVCMMRKLLKVTILLIFLLLVTVACSSDTVDENANNNLNSENNMVNEKNNDEPQEPVTITFMSDAAEHILESEWLEPLGEVFPHVTIEQVHVQSVNPEQVEEMVASGIYPDLAYFHNTAGIEIFDNYEMTFDLSDLIEKKGFDLSNINPSFLEEMYGYSDGKMYALPLTGMSWVTYYNKDIFDMMGVEYPRDNMTWTEMLELARELTQERDGIQYRGLDIGGEGWPLEQWSLAYADPETDEPLFTIEDGFRIVFEMLDELFSIPGNYSSTDQMHSFWIPFATERNIAMVASNEDTRGVFNGFEERLDSWDLVTWPQFEERPGYKPYAGGSYVGINEYSEHKDVVFDLIAYLVGEEHQKLLASEGYVPVLETKEVTDSFGSNYEFADKNLDAIFSLQHAPPPPSRRSDADFELPDLGAVVGHGIERLLLQEGDVQTILREMQEEAEGAVAEAKGRN